MSTYTSFDASTLEVGDVIHTIDFLDKRRKLLVMNIKSSDTLEKEYTVAHPFSNVVTHTEFNLEHRLSGFITVWISKPFNELELI